MWIKDDLIPNADPACKVICYDRDFIGGIDMMDNVEDAIKNTNCVVLLLYRAFPRQSVVHRHDSSCIYYDEREEVQDYPSSRAWSNR